MVVQRKNAQQLELDGSKQAHRNLHPQNNVRKRVDSGISASQMMPMLLDYYTVSSLAPLSTPLNSQVVSDVVDGAGWLLHVRSPQDT
jgi:hypothetical protein